MATTEYIDVLKYIQFNSNLLIQLSREAGNGTKQLALECRKLSMELTHKLKEFRTISILNDKLK